MPLYLTAAHSSRVRKPEISRRSSSSPFSTAQRTKSFKRTKSLADAVPDDDEQEDEDEFLASTGKVISVITNVAAKDVTSAIRHASSSMFEELPDRAGMNSTRIAEVLNFQKNLPPIVSLAHVHALISASSRTEREIQSLQATNQIRKIKVSGRGNDISGTSEVLILTADYKSLLLRPSSGLSSETVEAFSRILAEQPLKSSLPTSLFGPDDMTALTRAGFLVSASLSGTSRNTSLSGSSLVSIPSISRATSGTTAAVGGAAAFEHLGGTGQFRRTVSDPTLYSADLSLSIPNIGPYLRLLSAARTHLIDLLRRHPHRTTTLSLLRERWNGGVDESSRASVGKLNRAELSRVLPAKTKKWRDLNGLAFDWVLEECLGAGLVELFETHAVGYGVRCL